MPEKIGREPTDPRASRLARLNRLEGAGSSAYPGVPPLITHSAGEIKSEFERLEGTGVNIAGRITSIRRHGGIIFYDVEDEKDEIQVSLTRQGEEDERFSLTAETFDTGDVIHTRGVVSKTNRGEITVKSEGLDMLAKALQPPTSERDGITDPERGRRQRYLELMSNPNARERFRVRAKMVQFLREGLQHEGFLEVETPVLDTVYGGANAKPFITVMNALGDQEMFLRISPELYLKKVVGGIMGSVFEVSRNFRNEGLDRIHSPEFSLLEAYKPYADYEYWMKTIEQMFELIAGNVHGTTQVKYGKDDKGEDVVIDFKAPWKRLTIYDGLRDAYGFDPKEITDEELRVLGVEHGLPEKRLKRRGDLLLGLFEAHFDGKLIQPTFVKDYPRETSPLTKQHREDPELTERFECNIGGMEVMNCYTELNDPRIQRENFDDQDMRRGEGDAEAMPTDDDFIVAMEHGFPPMGGIGISIDRMAMLLTNTHNIQDIILFPPTRKIKQEGEEARELRARIERLEEQLRKATAEYAKFESK